MSYADILPTLPAELPAEVDQLPHGACVRYILTQLKEMTSAQARDVRHAQATNAEVQRIAPGYNTGEAVSLTSARWDRLAAATASRTEIWRSIFGVVYHACRKSPLVEVTGFGHVEDAMTNAALCAMAADRVGAHGLTDEDLEVLSAPWVNIMDSPHICGRP